MLCVFKWLTLCWNVFDVVSSFRHVFISVGLLVASLGLSVVWLHCLHFGSGILGCLKLGVLPVTSAMGGSDFPSPLT